MSFQNKIILGIGIIQAVLLLILIGSSLNLLRTSNEEALVRRATLAAPLFASSARDAVLSLDLPSLDSLVRAAITNHGLVYARVSNVHGGLLAEAGDQEVLSRLFVEDHRVQDVVDGVFDTRAEIGDAETVFGYFDLGISAKQIEDLLAAARQEMALIALTAMVLMTLFSFILGLYLTRELPATGVAVLLTCINYLSGLQIL